MVIPFIYVDNGILYSLLLANMHIIELYQYMIRAVAFMEIILRLQVEV